MLASVLVKQLFVHARCQVNLYLTCVLIDLIEGEGTMLLPPSLAEYVSMDVDMEAVCEAADGIASFPHMSVLAVEWQTRKWPTHNEDNEEESEEESEFAEDLEPVLLKSLSSDGQPSSALKSIIIEAMKDIRCIIPAKLPGLEELVIKSTGCLELSFEDPQCHFLRPHQALILAEPPMIDAADLALVSGSLSKRGMTLDAAAECSCRCAVRREQLLNRRQLCIYLRHVSEPSQSLAELCSLVNRLTECRCGACFLCLTDAGFLVGYRGRYLPLQLMYR